MSHPVSRPSSSTGTHASPEPDQPATPEKEKLFSLSPAQVLGGALAAMTAAALGTRLGVAGTIVGAALASVIAAVGGSLYTASIRASQQRVVTVLNRTKGPRPTVTTTISQQFNEPAAEIAEQKRGARRGWWKGAVVGAVAAFAIAAVALTSFELFTGTAISGGDGTTITQVSRDVSGGTGGPNESTPSASTTETVTESATPSEAPSASSTPTSSETASATPSETTPAAPSETPSASSTPTDSEPASATPSSGSNTTTEAPSATTAQGVSNP